MDGTTWKSASTNVKQTRITETGDKTHSYSLNYTPRSNLTDAASQTWDHKLLTDDEDPQIKHKGGETLKEPLNGNVLEPTDKSLSSTNDKFTSTYGDPLQFPSYVPTSTNTVVEHTTNVGITTNNSSDGSRCYPLQTENNTDTDVEFVDPKTRSPDIKTVEDNIQHQGMTSVSDLKYNPDEMSVDENETSQNETIVNLNSVQLPHRAHLVRKVTQNRTLLKYNPDTIIVDGMMKHTVTGRDVPGVFSSKFMLKTGRPIIVDNNSELELQQSPRKVVNGRHVIQDTIHSDHDTSSERINSFDMDVGRFFNSTPNDSYKVMTQTHLGDVHTLNERADTHTGMKRRFYNVQSKVDHSWHKNYPILRHIQSGRSSVLTVPNVERFDQFQSHSEKRKTNIADTALTHTVSGSNSGLFHPDEQPSESTFNKLNYGPSSKSFYNTPRSVTAYKDHEHTKREQISDTHLRKCEKKHSQNTLEHREHRPFINKSLTAQTKSEVSTTSSSGLGSGSRWHADCIPEYTKLWHKTKVPERKPSKEHVRHNKYNSNQKQGLTQSLPDAITSEKAKYKRYPQRWQKHTGLHEKKQREKEKQEKENIEKEAVRLPDVGVFYTRGNIKQTARLNWYNNTKDVSMSKAVEIIQSKRRGFDDDGVKQTEITTGYRLESRIKEESSARQWQFKSVNYDMDTKSLKSDKSGFLFLDDDSSDAQISGLRSSTELDKFLHENRKYKVCLRGNRMHYLSRKPHAKHHCVWPEE